jgi:hypothetical protein
MCRRRSGRWPVAPKVKASGAAAAAAAALVQLGLHLIWHSAPPAIAGYLAHVIADGGLALLAGYLAPHQNRTVPAAAPGERTPDHE